MKKKYMIMPLSNNLDKFINEILNKEELKDGDVYLITICKEGDNIFKSCYNFKDCSSDKNWNYVVGAIRCSIKRFMDRRKRHEVKRDNKLSASKEE